MDDIRERCDKCGAPAMVKAYFMQGILYFCGHHAKSLDIKQKAFHVEVHEDVKESIR